MTCSIPQTSHGMSTTGTTTVRAMARHTPPISRARLAVGQATTPVAVANVLQQAAPLPCTRPKWTTSIGSVMPAASTVVVVVVARRQAGARLRHAPSP